MKTWDLTERLFPLPRSLTGGGNRSTLAVVGETVPLTVHEVPTGTKVWSWTVPNEWNVYEAFIESTDLDWSISWDENPLHLLGYSTPHSGVLTYGQLAPHLYTVPSDPTAIPYLTSYYKDRWGFCLAGDQQTDMPKAGRFTVEVDVEHSPGSLTWAEAVLPGSLEDEVLFSTYICHPNLANDNVSGIVVATKLAEYVQSLPSHRYTYRFVFAPETLGTLCFIQAHWERRGRPPVAGYVLTTLGGPGPHVLKPSKSGDTLADRAVRHVSPGIFETPFTATGADERQFCSPLVDWPVAVIGKPLFYSFPEYHTSLDNLDYITERDLTSSIDLYIEIIDTLEANRRYWVLDPGIPKLDQYDLYPTLGAQQNQRDTVADVMAVCMFADGRDLIDIADQAGRRALDLAPLALTMTEKKLLEEI